MSAAVESPAAMDPATLERPARPSFATDLSRLREPALALGSGEDGLDLPLRILAGAADHLEENGLLVLEVGASAPALEAALPDVAFTWVEFERGGSGVAVLDRQSLLEHAADIADALAARGLAP